MTTLGDWTFLVRHSAVLFTNPVLGESSVHQSGAGETLSLTLSQRGFLAQFSG